MISKSIIKYIQSLQHKKFREQHGAFVAEGPKVVSGLLQANNFICKNIYATEKGYATITGLESKSDIKITVVKEYELEKLASLNTSNEVVGEFVIKPVFSSPVLKGRLTLLLDDIRDPGNFGTIIRTADWFGIENIICSLNTVDMYNPKVVQSTMASLGRVNIIYSDLINLVNQHPHITSYAATLDGSDLKRKEKIEEAFIIIGNESNGINRELLSFTQNKIRIPGYGQAESLNAAVAAGIILYAMR
jgi:TrmH family RNA methyltransferase